MAKNQFKNPEEVKKAKDEKKKVKGPGFVSNLKSKIQFLLSNEKLTKTVGLVFIVFSVFLLLAQSAYLFTWKIDQDKLSLPWNDILFNAEIKVENWLGKLGALVAHQLIFNGFGVAAFLIPFLSFLIGFRILFKTNLLPLDKSFKYSFFSILWASIGLGFIFFKQPILGGAFGYQSVIWISSVLGNIGVGLILLLSLLIFLVFNFNISFNFFSTKPDELIDETTLNETEVSNSISQLDENANNDSLDEEMDINDVAEIEDNGIIEEESNIEEIELDTTPLAKEEPKEKSEDIEFSVEEAESDDEVLTENELNSKVAEFGEYDPTLDLSSYQLPSVDLLKDFGDTQKRVTPEELEANKNRILETLENYNIKITSIKATIGPTVTLYEIVPEAGVRISKIKNLEDDIALSLAALGIRIIAPIPGKGTIGIEVPNQNPEIVPMRNVIASDKFQNAKMELPVVMGKTITNETFVFDLSKMPHLLMAGATGQGKSVGLNAVLTSLLYKKHPSQLKFVLVDPKKVELTLYNKIERHFLAKLPDTEEAIITENQKVINT
ncbi:MAG: DNA translocase FtsK 4TM domain-containing protein, partial [Flavobacteriales bacterium]|nr:DNA translocase FtsK 4TM domain-containing protein [Flavobacteriales bacterium]